MIDVRYELEQLDQNPEWLTVLETYDRLIDASKKANPDSEGWIARLREFEDVEQEDLSYIHGSLIAHGFLRFQIADRTSGMEYQLSQLGKRALERGPVDADDESDNDEDGDDEVDIEFDDAAGTVEDVETIDCATDEPVVAEIDGNQDEFEEAAIESSADLPDTTEVTEELVQLAFAPNIPDASEATEIVVGEAEISAADVPVKDRPVTDVAAPDDAAADALESESVPATFNALCSLSDELKKSA